jgi:hypothetical protein
MAGDSYDRRLTEAAVAELEPDEHIVGMLPFATVPKRPRGPEGKILDGIYQSQRRYRPLVVTDHRLLLFDSGRVPYPRGLLGAFPLAELAMSDPEPGRMGVVRFVLSLPGAGEVPFETGQRDDLDALRANVSG